MRKSGAQRRMQNHPVFHCDSSAAIDVETDATRDEIGRVRSTLVLRTRGSNDGWKMEERSENEPGKAFSFPLQIGRGRGSCHTKRGERNVKEGERRKRRKESWRSSAPSKEMQRRAAVDRIVSTPSAATLRKSKRLKRQRALSTSSPLSSRLLI